ncbi:DNA cytosine methyltransferase [Adlercreutzia muris]|uniref:DNA cytosine methyltransferase n=1 Tax=Adlercreutzia muris TaxID=1796610 RepID=UPI00351454BF
MELDRTPKMNSFFAGIGGFDLGFENAGFDISYICEINDYCNKVLDTHWPDVARGQDINEVNLSEIPQAEVWCGGFPCQDISVARGSLSRLGLNGSRSGLFYRFAELVESKKPGVVLIENVGGLFNSNKGHDLLVVLKTMNDLGYAVAWRLLNSRYFGVPQSRPRVYICCWKKSPSAVLRCMFDPMPNATLEGERKAFLAESTPTGKYPRVPTVGYCLAATSGRHTGTDWSRTYATCEDGVRRLTPIECERLQGFPDDWTRTSNGYDPEESDSLRYAAIGNAVSVPVVEAIARRIAAILKETPKKRALNEKALAGYPVFNGNDWMALSDIDDMPIDQKISWPKAGLVWEGRYIAAKANTAPSVPAKSSLYEIMQHGRVEDRYYLSPNAAEGILRRVDNNQRHLFEPLRDGLERLSGRKA